MIDSSLMIRTNPGTAVGSPAARCAGDSIRTALRERFSGPTSTQERGRSVSTSARGLAGDAVAGVAALRVSAPFTRIAAAVVADAVVGTGINLSIDNNETSAERAVSGARAWSPPD